MAKKPQQNKPQVDKKIPADETMKDEVSKEPQTETEDAQEKQVEAPAASEPKGVAGKYEKFL